MRILRVLMLAVVLSLSAAAHAGERIISKAEVELIFSMSRAAWEAYAPRIHDERWKLRLQKTDTGTTAMAFDPATGRGLSVQPFFIDDGGPPAMLRVGIFYPTDRLPPNLAALRGEIEKEAQRDLGSLYEVSAEYVKLSPSLQGIELSIVKSSNTKK